MLSVAFGDMGKSDKASTFHPNPPGSARLHLLLLVAAAAAAQTCTISRGKAVSCEGSLTMPTEFELHPSSGSTV
eukprot:258763-Chlamydomonas_euryale.AAC.6